VDAERVVRVGVPLPNSVGDRRFDGRGSRLHELTQRSERGEHLLTGYTELFREFMNSRLA
jgi:hypothetical protein